MSHIRLKGWLEIAGTLAIVTSLVFVGLQMRQENNIAMADTYGPVASNSLQLAELMGGSAELWRRGLDGEELSPEEQIKFFSLANAVESSFVMTWSRTFQLGATTPEAALRDYAFALHSHAGLRRYFDSKIQLYEETDKAFNVRMKLGSFRASILMRLDFLAVNSVPVPEQKAYVFWN